MTTDNPDEMLSDGVGVTAFDPEAAVEIGRLVTRIVKLAPAAGLHVGITIEPAKATPGKPLKER